MDEEQVKRPLDDSELQAVVGGAGSASTMEQLAASGDIQTLMQMVTAERAALLDTQMTDQVRQVQARNDTIAALNDGVSGLQGLLDQFTDDQGNVDPAMTISLDQARAGFAGLDGFLERHGLGELDRDHSGAISADELTTMIDAAHQQVASASAEQQMDMLRLQSLMNKRNESFDMMRQFSRQTDDSRESIIRNI
ncbi:MAG: hypothetical protein H3C51_00565 [Rubellimicrobium sp.]|nr:hypothetical protein [Rubellimicrobium sp.]